MSKFEEIIGKYTKGEATLPETNEALKEAGSGYHLDPARNVLTAEELEATTVGATPADADGWGLMEHGASCMEKVHVVDGRTVNVDMGCELAFVYIGGKKYKLSGTELQDVSEEG